jgi:hypothetical protein
MRTAAICPTCSTYTNSVCVIYNGNYLSCINASPLDPLDTILTNINSAVCNINTSITNLSNAINSQLPLSGTTAPTVSATYLGQLYVNTTTSQLYFATSLGTNGWVTCCAPVPPANRIFDRTFDNSFN